ncbi:hypothetical protein [Streptomyces sp. NPDC047841]|uniref:HAAS signaling domain-containing protein n=1 Tax=Streptomyces sp. NPDC047841 TaxID=3154708 RepID=UPI0034537105
MSLSTSPSVQAFLAAVERETSALPADRRQELLADLAEHIEVALSERPGQEQAILAELGDPRTIAATALESGPTAPQRPQAKRPGTVTALRVLLYILTAVVVIATIGTALGYYPGPVWLQTLLLLPSLVSAVHVFFLQPGRSVLRATLTVTVGIYFIGEATNVMRGEPGGVLGVLLSVAVLTLLHVPSSRAWFAETAS